MLTRALIAFAMGLPVGLALIGCGKKVQETVVVSDQAGQEYVLKGNVITPKKEGCQ